MSEEKPQEKINGINRFNLANLAAFLVNVVFTLGVGEGVSFGLNLPTTSEVSDKYPTLITPASSFFGIAWLVIFACQFVWAAGQILVPSWRKSPYITSLEYQYVYVVFFQALWTILFGLEIVWAALAAMAILAVLLYTGVHVLSHLATFEQEELELSTKDMAKNYVFFRLPWTFHFGWILAALAVNLQVVLVSFNVGDASQALLSILSVAALIAIGAWNVHKKSEYGVAAAVAWALLGIFASLHMPLAIIQTTFSNFFIQTAKWSSMIGTIGVLGLCGKDFADFMQGKTADDDEEDESVGDDYVRAEAVSEQV